MFAFVARRCVYSLSSRSTGALLVSLTRTRIPVVRPLSLTPVHYNIPNMQQMMDELSKNPKAMAVFEAIKKNPKIMHAVQDLMMIMSKKGYLDLKNPTKQPSKSTCFYAFKINVSSLSYFLFRLDLAMLADNEIRTKLFELVKLLAAAGVFNAKDGANPLNAFSNIMGLLMPPSSKDKKADRLGDSKQTSSPKYDYTYDATEKNKNAQSNDNTAEGWADKFKKIFK